MPEMIYFSKKTIPNVKLTSVLNPEHVILHQEDVILEIRNILHDNKGLWWITIDLVTYKSHISNWIYFL